MDAAETDPNARLIPSVISRLEVGGWAIALGAVAATVVAYWLPIFEVGGFAYTMIDSYRGGDQFLAAVALPIALGLAILIIARRRWLPAALAAVVMTTLAPVDHLTEAVWRGEHPERFGSPFALRGGFVVALAGIFAGAVLFIGLVRWLLAAPTARDRDTPTAVARAIAVIGLLLAIAGQVAESSDAHLWQLPRWPQVGRWWKLVVTTAIVGAAVWRQGAAALAAGALVAIVAAASAAQEINAVAGLDDDLAVSTTVTMVGLTLVAVALITALVGSLRRR